MRSLKENNKYFVDATGVGGYVSQQNRDFFNLNDCGTPTGNNVNVIGGLLDKVSGGSSTSDELGHHYTDNVNEIDESSIKDSCKTVGSKRKRFEDEDSTGNMMMTDSNSVLKYKNNSADYIGIRARNCDNVQNEEYNRLNASEEHNSRIIEDGGGGGGGGSGGAGSGSVGGSGNVNYASSDDLNQTNSSEHGGEKGVLSGSDDESTGIFNLFLLQYFVICINTSKIICNNTK